MWPFSWKITPLDGGRESSSHPAGPVQLPAHRGTGSGPSLAHTRQEGAQRRIPLKIPPRKRVGVPHSCFQDPRSCCLQTTELSDFLQEIQASGASLLFSTVNLATIVTVRGGWNGHGISNLPHLNVTIKLETKLFSNWLENLKNQSIVALTTNSHRFNKSIY